MEEFMCTVGLKITELESSIDSILFHITQPKKELL